MRGHSITRDGKTVASILFLHAIRDCSLPSGVVQREGERERERERDTTHSFIYYELIDYLYIAIHLLIRVHF